jgi:hypothetical protein
MADRTYVSNSPTTVTTRELLTVAVSFANRLGDGETVSVVSNEVLLQDKATGTDKTAALSGPTATSPNVSVTIDFRNVILEKSKTYVLRVLGTIGSRKEEACWDFVTSFL